MCVERSRGRMNVLEIRGRKMDCNRAGERGGLDWKDESLKAQPENGVTAELRATLDV